MSTALRRAISTPKIARKVSSVAGVHRVANVLIEDNKVPMDGVYLEQRIITRMITLMAPLNTSCIYKILFLNKDT